HAGGQRFDGGPYILLDRSGLEWAFAALGLRLDDEAVLRRVEDVYEVGWDDGMHVAIHADLRETAAGIERVWPGGGRRYEAFVAAAARAYARLQPLLVRSGPGLLDLLQTGAWRGLPFLLKPLRRVLDDHGLPPRLAEAVAVWTHVAGR